MRGVLAHIGGVPVEENLIYLAPVVLVVGFIYLQSWRERRHPERYPERHEGNGDLAWGDDALSSLEEPSRAVHDSAAQGHSADAA